MKYVHLILQVINDIVMDYVKYSFLIIMNDKVLHIFFIKKGNI
jgi:hypothetical protein